MTTKEILTRALQAFGPQGEQWTNGILGEPYKHCALTMIGACVVNAGGILPDDQYCAIKAALFDALPPEYSAPNEVRSIISYNDGHQWPDIKAWFERAIAAAA
jgi:hypothetical protein